jgi:hypothetical protein
MRQNPLAVARSGGRQGSHPLEAEDARVDTAGRGVQPAQIRGRHGERRLASQNLPQMMQLPAQVGQRLRARRVRPEQPGDPLPRLRRSGMRDQKATRAIARDEHARMPVPSPVTACSPRTDTCSISTLAS